MFLPWAVVLLNPSPLNLEEPIQDRRPARGNDLDAAGELETGAERESDLLPRLVDEATLVHSRTASLAVTPELAAYRFRPSCIVPPDDGIVV